MLKHVNTWFNIKNVANYLNRQKIDFERILNIITIPSARNQSCCFFGLPRSGKTHFANCLVHIFQGSSLPINSKLSFDFLVASAHGAPLVHMDDVEDEGWKNLSSHMPIIDGTPTAINQKYKEISQREQFPPSILTTNDLNDSILTFTTTVSEELKERAHIVWSRIFMQRIPHGNIKESEEFQMETY